jgi:hypothetical protein
MLPTRDLSDARAMEFMRRGVVSGEMPGQQWSAQRLARITGLLYLVVALLGMFAPLVLGSVLVEGDAAATADNVLGAQGLFASSLLAWIAIVVADIAIAVTLYLLLVPTAGWPVRCPSHLPLPGNSDWPCGCW